MEYAEKMYLVPSHQLEQLRAPPPVEENIRTTATRLLDAEMKSVLQRTDLAEYEKAKLYSAVLQRYLTYVRQSDADKRKISLFLPEQSDTAKPPETENTSDSVVQELLDNVNKRYKKNASVLLNKLGQDKTIASWNDKGAFVYKGSVVNGSNMLDLVRAVTQTRSVPSRHVPKGWEVFINAMAELNAPSSIMGSADNRVLWERLKASATDTGMDRETPTPVLPSKNRKLAKLSDWLSV
nr:uncharacterized protein LOC112544205 isoform X1 [Pelodiscus sinensis]XP_025035761.1 uncharacterized protein LOC112544205 isoform X2 [Pelodiscus sinensis]|eukprot:XP_025035760.1 uncharacterized protein LOC112544205 isoform X1 [Pelodiscus sinensis]